MALTVVFAAFLATEAELSSPVGLALDRGNTLYIADAGNGRVRTVAADGTISTVVQFEVPRAGAQGSVGVIQAVTLDDAGALYVAHPRQVHRMPAAEPVVDAPIAGGNTTRGQDDVPATESVVWSPIAAITDPRGNLYIAEPENYRVRVVTPDGKISTFAGGAAGFSGDGGPAAEAQFIGPRALAADREGNLYIADLSAVRVRMVSAASGLISTVAGDGRRVCDGDGGPARQAGLMYPQAIAVDGRGNLYIADSQAHRIRKLTPDNQP